MTCTGPLKIMLSTRINFPDLKMVLSVTNGIFRSRYSRMDHLKFFKGSLPQTLLGPFLKPWPISWLDLCWVTADRRFPWRTYYTTNISLFKVHNRNTRKMCEKCSKLTMQTLQRLQEYRKRPVVWNRLMVTAIMI